MKTISISILITLLSTLDTTGQIKEKAYIAYVKSSQSLWEHVVKKAAESYEAQPTDVRLFDYALVSYGLLNATMADQNEVVFDQYVDTLDELLDQLRDKQYREPEVMALQSAVAGLKIAYSPWKGMLLGPKSGYLIDEAVAKGGDLPIVQKLYANYLLFTPETWGGDLKKASSYYQTAISAFESKNMKDHWMYLDALVWQSQALLKLGKKEEAVALLEYAITIEENFTWVAQVLLPEARKS